jgi:hypothetical protein
MTKRKRTGAGAIAHRQEKWAAAAAARAAGAERGSAGVLPAAAAAITELYRRRSGSASGAAAAASGTHTLAVRGRMANSDGRRMMRRAAGVLAPESAASAGEQRRARGRARCALEHRFRVTKALAGYLSFKVLDAYLGGRVPGRGPEAGEIGDEATLAVRRRLEAEGERWRRETDPDRREFRRAAFGSLCSRRCQVSRLSTQMAAQPNLIRDEFSGSKQLEFRFRSDSSRFFSPKDTKLKVEYELAFCKTAGTFADNTEHDMGRLAAATAVHALATPLHLHRRRCPAPCHPARTRGVGVYDRKRVP